MHNLEAIATAVKGTLDEHYEGYALVGFTADQDHPMTIINTAHSSLKRMALQAMLHEAAIILMNKPNE